MFQGEMQAASMRPPRTVCIGETMLMLAPPPGERLEDAAAFRPYLGGAESNVAIGLARLGAPAAWIGKLPRNPLARRIVNEMRSSGVDTSAVVWSDEGRLGLFFFEFAAPPRPQLTIYDRASSCAATLSAHELDWGLISSADWVHLTGITPALGPGAREATRKIMVRAKEKGLRVSFDVNYRSLLWSAEEAAQALGELLPHVDLLIATECDAEILLGRPMAPQDALRRLLERNPHRAVVITFPAGGSLGYDGQAYYRSEGYPAQVVNRLGAGDAFAAGLLYGYWKGGLGDGVRYGSSMAALKLTIPQNTPVIDKAEVERLLAGSPDSLVR